MTRRHSILHDIRGHPLFFLGLAGISQTLAFSLAWNWIAAASVRSSMPEVLAPALMASILSGGVGFILGGSVLGRGGISAPRISALALVSQSIVALAMAMRLPFPGTLASAFGLATGLFYVGRNYMEVSAISCDTRDRWLASLSSVSQICSILMPFAIATLSPVDFSPSGVGYVCLAILAMQIPISFGLWRMPCVARASVLGLGGVVSGFVGLFRTGGKWLFFLLESFFWIGRTFGLPMAAGLLMSSQTSQGLAESLAALSSALVGSLLVRHWTQKSRGRFLAASTIPLCLCWMLVAIVPSPMSFVALVFCRSIFQPFSDTAFRGAILEGAKIDGDGLPTLCGREILLVIGRGGMLAVFLAVGHALGPAMALAVASASASIAGILCVCVLGMGTGKNIAADQKKRLQ